MKRLITLLAAVVAFATMASAQAQFGLEGGVGIKKMTFSKDVYKADNYTGFFVGPVDASLQYAMNKAKIAESRTKHMSYLRLPVNLRWDIGTSLIGVYAATGPQWDWLIGNSDLKTLDGLEATFEHSIFSWNVGAGLMFAKHMELGASYSIPLSKAGSVRNVYDQVAGNIKIKNQEWQVRLCYFF